MTAAGPELRQVLSLETYWRPDSDIRWFRLVLGQRAFHLNVWPIVLLAVILLGIGGYSIYRLERLWRSNRSNYQLLTETRAVALAKETQMVHEFICQPFKKDPGFKVFLEPPPETKTHPLNIPADQLEPFMRSHWCGTVTVALTNGWRVQAWESGRVNVVIPPKYLLVKRWASGRKRYATYYLHTPGRVQIIKSGRIHRSFQPQSNVHYYINERGRPHRLYVARQKLVVERIAQ